MKISLNILSKFILFYFFTRKQLKKTESFFAVHTWRLVDQISDCFAVVQIHFIEKEGIAQRKWSCMAGTFLDTTSLSLLELEECIRMGAAVLSLPSNVPRQNMVYKRPAFSLASFHSRVSCIVLILTYSNSPELVSFNPAWWFFLFFFYFWNLVPVLRRAVFCTHEKKCFPNENPVI